MAWGDVPAVLPPNDDRHWVVLVVLWLGMGISGTLISARLFTRHYLMRTADWTDAVLGFSGILALVATSLQTVAGLHGAGRHVYYLTPQQIATASLYGTVAVPFGQMAMSFPKVAAAAVLLRIAGPSAGRKVKIYFYSICGVLCTLSALYCIFLFVQCTPVFALWTEAPDAKCWPGMVVATFGVVNSVWSAFVDINLAIYPIFIMRRLQMELRKKVTVCSLMGLGLLATVCAAFKIPHLKDQISSDITWNIVALTCWTESEMNIILIAASIPMLRPLWLWVRGEPLSSSKQGGSRKKSGYSSKKGFMSFGSKKDSRNEMTIDVGFNETTTPRGDGRVLMTPPPDALKMERMFAVQHEEV